jgi:hypothetical protein
MTGAFVWGAANAHMNAKDYDNYKNVEYHPETGGTLTINYWYPNTSGGSSTPAAKQEINVATWARWYINLGN